MVTAIFSQCGQVRNWTFDVRKANLQAGDVLPNEFLAPAGNIPEQKSKFSIPQAISGQDRVTLRITSARNSTGNPSAPLHLDGLSAYRSCDREFGGEPKAWLGRLPSKLPGLPPPLRLLNTWRQGRIHASNRVSREFECVRYFYGKDLPSM